MSTQSSSTQGKRAIARVTADMEVMKKIGSWSIKRAVIRSGITYSPVLPVDCGDRPVRVFVIETTHIIRDLNRGVDATVNQNQSQSSNWPSVLLQKCLSWPGTCSHYLRRC